MDWDRECFTMDDKLSRAVTESFVRMSEKVSKIRNHHDLRGRV